QKILPRLALVGIVRIFPRREEVARALREATANARLRDPVGVPEVLVAAEGAREHRARLLVENLGGARLLLDARAPALGLGVEVGAVIAGEQKDEVGLAASSELPPGSGSLGIAEHRGASGQPVGERPIAKRQMQEIGEGALELLQPAIGKGK